MYFLAGLKLVRTYSFPNVPMAWPVYRKVCWKGRDGGRMGWLRRQGTSFVRGLARNGF